MFREQAVTVDDGGGDVDDRRATQAPGTDDLKSPSI
jgi:hypothetical protein